MLPLLVRRFGHSVGANLAASAEALSRDREWIEEIFRRETESEVELSPGAASVRLSALAGLPPAGVRRLLLVMARAAGGDRFAPTRRELLAIERLAGGGEDFRFQAGRRVDFVARRGRLRAIAAPRNATSKTR